MMQSICNYLPYLVTQGGAVKTDLNDLHKKPNFDDVG